MQIEVKVALVDSQGKRFMGAGPLWLLEGVGRTGSIRQVAQAMGMSYAKAHRILGRLEQALGLQLLVRRVGGAERGGAELTPEGLSFLERYTRLCQSVQACAESESAPFQQVCQELRERQAAATGAAGQGDFATGG